MRSSILLIYECVFKNHKNDYEWKNRITYKVCWTIICYFLSSWAWRVYYWSHINTEIRYIFYIQYSVNTIYEYWLHTNKCRVKKNLFAWEQYIFFNSTWGLFENLMRVKNSSGIFIRLNVLRYRKTWKILINLVAQVFFYDNVQNK